MRTPLGIGLIGTKFMGRAHSTAWLKVARFFDLPLAPRMVCVAGRNPRETREFATRWGWEQSTAEWKDLLVRPDVTLVDICTPNDCHAEMTLAALEAGKHVACEKPLAATLKDARRMRDAARRRRSQKTFVWFNYRRCPAVAFAHQLAMEGKLGRIYHVRACYLQDWGKASTPLLWRFQAAHAGSGAHGDLNAHIIDMARFITGDEITEVSGAIEKTFITERTVVESSGGAISGRGAKKKGRRRKGRSDVDDCVLFLARMRSGAVASFEATRLATGNQNRNQIEINGEKGSIRFDFERMNELQWWDDTLPSRMRGWSRIMCTNAGDHPYAGAYWPPAHLIGYEHGFISMASDIALTLAGKKPPVPVPDIEDAYRTQCVLEAAIRSARERRPVTIREVE